MHISQGKHFPFISFQSSTGHVKTLPNITNTFKRLTRKEMTKRHKKPVKSKRKKQQDKPQHDEGDMDRDKQATSLTAAMETREGKGGNTHSSLQGNCGLSGCSPLRETMSSKDRYNQKFKASSVGHAALLKFSQKFPILAVLENNYLDQ